VTVTPGARRSAQAELELPSAASVRLTATRPTTAAISFEEGSHRGRPREGALGREETAIGIARATRMRWHLPTATTICGLATGSAAVPDGG
jgi:hypothetical protein